MTYMGNERVWEDREELSPEQELRLSLDKEAEELWDVFCLGCGVELMFGDLLCEACATDAATDLAELFEVAS